MRLKGQAKAGFYPTPVEVVEILKSWIGEKRSGPKRLLDPCCGTGEAAAEIAKAAQCQAYGVEIHTAQGTIRGGQFVGGFPGGAYEIHYEIEQEEGFVFLAGEIDLEKVD